MPYYRASKLSKHQCKTSATNEFSGRLYPMESVPGGCLSPLNKRISTCQIISYWTSLVGIGLGGSLRDQTGSVCKGTGSYPQSASCALVQAVPSRQSRPARDDRPDMRVFARCLSPEAGHPGARLRTAANLSDEVSVSYPSARCMCSISVDRHHRKVGGSRGTTFLPLYASIMLTTKKMVSYQRTINCHYRQIGPNEGRTRVI